MIRNEFDSFCSEMDSLHSRIHSGIHELEWLNEDKMVHILDTCVKFVTFRIKT